MTTTITLTVIWAKQTWWWNTRTKQEPSSMRRRSRTVQSLRSLECGKRSTKPTEIGSSSQSSQHWSTSSINSPHSCRWTRKCAKQHTTASRSGHFSWTFSVPYNECRDLMLKKSLTRVPAFPGFEWTATCRGTGALAIFDSGKLQSFGACSDICTRR